MPFVWKGGEEPILEKRRRERDKKRLDALHFKWLDAVVTGNRASGVEAALEWRKLAEELYGEDFIEDDDEPANDP
jgi:hypothetical protein